MRVKCEKMIENGKANIITNSLTDPWYKIKSDKSSDNESHENKQNNKQLVPA